MENSEITSSKSETAQKDSVKSDIKSVTDNNEINGSLISVEKNSVKDGLISKSDFKTGVSEQTDKISCVAIEDNKSSFIEGEMSHKRFLQCPAAVRMSHLMKFLRMKFALSNEHRVSIFLTVILIYQLKNVFKLKIIRMNRAFFCLRIFFADFYINKTEFHVIYSLEKFRLFRNIYYLIKYLIVEKILTI